MSTQQISLYYGTASIVLVGQAVTGPQAAAGSGSGDMLAANNLSDVASAATSRTNLGLAIGTNVQAYDAELAALASVTSAADALPYFTGSGTATTTTLTAAARTVLDDATVGAMLTTLGGQPLDTDLTAIAALSSAADKVPYSTGAGTWALADFTAAGRALVDDANAAAQLTTLGAAPSARSIATTAPLTGGGDLSADRTLAVSAASTTASGVIEIATNAESLTGTDAVRAVAPDSLAYVLARQSEVFVIAVGDETTAITTGTAKVTWRMPFAFTVTAVRSSLTTASSSGLPTVDINEAGTSIISTKLTIDANELTSTTAATPAVISDSALADDALMTIDIDTAGTGAAGLKVYIIGTRA